MEIFLLMSPVNYISIFHDAKSRQRGLYQFTFSIELPVAMYWFRNRSPRLFSEKGWLFTALHDKSCHVGNIRWIVFFSIANGIQRFYVGNKMDVLYCSFCVWKAYKVIFYSEKKCDFVFSLWVCEDHLRLSLTFCFLHLYSKMKEFSGLINALI